MIVLFDYDSFIYKSVYRIVTFRDIRKLYNEGHTKKYIELFIVDQAINRLTQGTEKLYEEIEETGIEITGVEYYITACRQSERKRRYPSYKDTPSRKNNRLTKWVSKVRQYLLDGNFAVTSDKWEADDLIADRANEFDEPTDYIILSMDKDLKQIPGIHYNYYRPRKKDPKTGERIEEPCIGLTIVDYNDAMKFFWTQMLVGDKGDGIDGIKDIGPVKAKKELIECKTSQDYEVKVKHIYESKIGEGWEEEFEKNNFLLYLSAQRFEMSCT